MTKTGRFETSTKTKINTPYGTVLKITTYEYECTQPFVEYRIRGTCKYCGNNTECWCFSDEYFEDPLHEAIEYLSTGFVCDTPKCVIKFEKENYPDDFKELQAIYGNDEYELRNAIWESWGDCDEGPVECSI